MLYGIEGILNGKLFGNGEGGSSGGGITLPELTNPAGADQILEGYEAIDGSGNKLTGTHVCESGGGGGETGYLRVTGAVTVPASSSSEAGSALANHVGPETGEGGYIPGTPILYICRKVNSNSGMSAMTYFNASDSDYTLASGEYETVITHAP